MVTKSLNLGRFTKHMAQSTLLLAHSFRGLALFCYFMKKRSQLTPSKAVVKASLFEPRKNFKKSVKASFFEPF